MKAGLLLLAAGLLTAAAAGQEGVIDLLAQTGRPSVKATLLASTGSGHFLGYGFMTVDLVNPRSGAEDVELRITDSYGEGNYRANATVTLGPGGSSRIWVPLPDCTPFVIARLRAHGVEGSFYLQRPTGGRRALLIATDSALIAAWNANALFTNVARNPKGGATATTLLTRMPADLPPSWQMLTSFPLVVVDERADGLRKEQLAMLADYARAGGTLALLRASARPGEEGRPPSLGTTLRIAGNGRDELASGPLREALERSGAKPRPFSLPAGLTFPREIPGLARPPVEAFTLLTIAFLLFVLFALFWFVRRKKQPLWLLLVLPGTGFGTAGVTILFGFVSEGLDIKGTSEAVTWLDQESHQHVTVASRTLFAPISPSRLVPEAGTGLFGELLPPTGRSRTNHALELTLGRAFAPSGAALPARAPTAFATVTCGESRERLRFQREGAAWRVLAAPGLAPDASRDSVLFRDPEGKLWIGAPGKALEPAGSRDASDFLGEAFTPPPPIAHPSRPPNYQGSTIAAGEDLRTFLTARNYLELAPGSYLALVRENPLLDSLGLTVDWRSRLHLVIGRLGKEDLIR